MGSWVPTRDPVSLARSAMKLQNSPVLGCLPCPNPHSLALCLLQIRAEPRPPFSLEIITGWFRRVSRCQRVPSYLPSPKRLFLCGFGTGAQRAAPAHYATYLTQGMQISAAQKAAPSKPLSRSISKLRALSGNSCGSLFTPCSPTHLGTGLPSTTCPPLLGP